MHPLPSLPRHPLVAGLVALLVALILIAAAAPELGTIDFSIGGGSSADAPSVESIPTNPEVTEAPKPRWVTDPLASPLETLAGRQ